MSYSNVGLGRLLRALYCDERQRISLLREDIRLEIRSQDAQVTDEPRDFYVPFWADAKQHIAGLRDLGEATNARIASHRGRYRLYPILQNGFLLWWNERRRSRNVAFRVISNNVKARYEVEGVGLIRVENTISITIGEDENRIIYPYFYEDPELAEEAARLALWVMIQCVQGYSASSMTILDIIHSRAFSLQDVNLLGNEENVLINRYQALLAQRDTLRRGYD